MEQSIFFSVFFSVFFFFFFFFFFFLPPLADFILGQVSSWARRAGFSACTRPLFLYTRQPHARPLNSWPYRLYTRQPHARPLDSWS